MRKKINILGKFSVFLIIIAFLLFFVLSHSATSYSSISSNCVPRTNEYWDRSGAGAPPGSVHACCKFSDSCVSVGRKCMRSNKIYYSKKWLCYEGKWDRCDSTSRGVRRGKWKCGSSGRWYVPKTSSSRNSNSLLSGLSVSSLSSSKKERVKSIKKVGRNNYNLITTKSIYAISKSDYDKIKKEYERELKVRGIGGTWEIEKRRSFSKLPVWVLIPLALGSVVAEVSTGGAATPAVIAVGNALVAGSSAALGIVSLMHSAENDGTINNVERGTVSKSEGGEFLREIDRVIGDINSVEVHTKLKHRTLTGSNCPKNSLYLPPKLRDALRRGEFPEIIKRLNELKHYLSDDSSEIFFKFRVCSKDERNRVEGILTRLQKAVKKYLKSMK
jgi:hypothetical protein